MVDLEVVGAAGSDAVLGAAVVPAGSAGLLDGVGDFAGVGVPGDGDAVAGVQVGGEVAVVAG